MNMCSLFSRGFPRKHEFEPLLRSTSLAELRASSSDFETLSERASRAYGKKWVSSPVWQWSRLWEYTEVYQQVAAESANMPGIRVLDAGSGLTFLPFFLASLANLASVECCDIDPTLEPSFAAVLKDCHVPVSFRLASLSALPYCDGEFDFVYSISVLEHVRDPIAVLEELWRVLKPGGLLVVTYDVSLTGRVSIASSMMTKILETVGNWNSGLPSYNWIDELRSSDLWTTREAARADPALLPWRHAAVLHQMYRLLKTRKWVEWPPHLTVHRLILRKPYGRMEAV